MSLFVGEKCTLYGGSTAWTCEIWNSNIYLFSGGVYFIKVSIDGGSTVFSFS